MGSAAFDLFPIHAVCVVMPRAGSMKKISDLGVWLVELFWSFWAYIWLYVILEVTHIFLLSYLTVSTKWTFSHNVYFAPCTDVDA